VTVATIRGDVAVIENNGLKIIDDMTVITGAVSSYMSFMLTGGDNTVVARGATPRNTGVIITAVCLQFHKTVSIVTVIAFDSGGWVLIGWADGSDTVMTLAAFAENF